MSSALQTAVEDLRAALADEDAGNGRVRDCAFEVVEAWDAAAERTPALQDVDTHLQDYAKPAGAVRRRRRGDHEPPRDQAGAHHLPRVPAGGA